MDVAHDTVHGAMKFGSNNGADCACLPVRGELSCPFFGVQGKYGPGRKRATPPDGPEWNLDKEVAVIRLDAVHFPTMKETIWRCSNVDFVVDVLCRANWGQDASKGEKIAKEAHIQLPPDTANSESERPALNVTLASVILDRGCPSAK